MEILIGLAIGLAIGTTGVGGGVLTAPTLILFLGLPPARSIGTALLFSAIAKTVATAMYVWRRQVDFQVLRYLLAGGVPGAIAGSLLLKKIFRNQQNGAVLCLVGATVAVSAVFSILSVFRRTTKRRTRLGALPFLSFLIGLEVGFSSAGAGALGTVMLIAFAGLPPLMVIGTDLVFGMVLSAVGGGIHAVSGNWDGPLLMKLLIGGMAGVLIGSRMASILPARILRGAILAWALLMGATMVHQGIGRIP